MAQRLNNFFLALFSGLLLWLSWYPHGFIWLIFIAFVPLFFLSDLFIQKNKGFVFGQGVAFSFPVFLIWNVGVTWWIWNSTPPGAVAALVLNSFFMSCVFGAWHWVKKSKLPKIMISVTFIAFWCSWEYLHLNWQITWSWLNLGNVFAANPKMVQWYEYTGTFGGTIWILMVNFLVYKFFILLKQRWLEKKSDSFLSNLRYLCVHKIFVTLIITIIIPITISFIIYKTYKIKTENGVEVVIVQHNVDPWEEQYNKTNFELATLLVEVASSKLTPSTELVVCSESSLSNTICEEQLQYLNIYPHPAFLLFDSLLQDYPKLNIIFGLSTARQFDTKISASARAFSDGSFVEFYNTSCLYNGDTLQLYRKSKLVPGVEKMPYPKIFGFLEKLAIDLGGISGSLGIDTEQRAFDLKTGQGVMKIGAPICYESIFGELFSEFVRHGAQLMCVITNDSWWGNTPGHKQHFAMSALRAIENRRYVLRAANSGISAFFDPLGNHHLKTKYETRTAITQTVYPNGELTFYTKHGDYLAKIMLVIAGVVFLVRLINCLRFKGQRFKDLKIQ